MVDEKLLDVNAFNFSFVQLWLDLCRFLGFYTV
jgi:hypothetical protein